VLEALPAGAASQIWAPYAGETEGFSTRVSNVAAMKAGLKFRTIDQTTTDTLAWFKALPPERQKRLFDGAARMLTAEKEAELCAAVKQA
jgi:2'-hydroxyisoflavone reductase